MSTASIVSTPISVSTTAPISGAAETKENIAVAAGKQRGQKKIRLTKDIQGIQKSCYPLTVVDGRAKKTFEQAIRLVLTDLLQKARELMKINRKSRTLTSHDIRAAVWFVCEHPMALIDTTKDNLATVVLNSSQKVVENYEASLTKSAQQKAAGVININPETGKPVTISKAKRAGLLLRVGPIERIVRDTNLFKRLDGSVAVEITAILETILCQFLDLASEVCHRSNKSYLKPLAERTGRITNRHMVIAIDNDVDFKALFRGVSILGAGIAPNYKRLLAETTATATTKNTKKRNTATRTPRTTNASEAAVNNGKKGKAVAAISSSNVNVKKTTTGKGSKAARTETVTPTVVVPVPTTKKSKKQIVTEEPVIAIVAKRRGGKRKAEADVVEAKEVVVVKTEPVSAPKRGGGKKSKLPPTPEPEPEPVTPATPAKRGAKKARVN